jgi:hypothetical protein
MSGIIHWAIILLSVFGMRNCDDIDSKCRTVDWFNETNKEMLGGRDFLQLFEAGEDSESSHYYRQTYISFTLEPDIRFFEKVKMLELARSGVKELVNKELAILSLFKQEPLFEKLHQCITFDFKVDSGVLLTGLDGPVSASQQIVFLLYNGPLSVDTEHKPAAMSHLLMRDLSLNSRFSVYKSFTSCLTVLERAGLSSPFLSINDFEYFNRVPTDFMMKDFGKLHPVNQIVTSDWQQLVIGETGTDFVMTSGIEVFRFAEILARIELGETIYEGIEPNKLEDREARIAIITENIRNQLPTANIDARIKGDFVQLISDCIAEENRIIISDLESIMHDLYIRAISLKSVSSKSLIDEANSGSGLNSQSGFAAGLKIAGVVFLLACLPAGLYMLWSKSAKK